MVASAANVLALAGKLDSPSLSFPKDFPQAARTNFLAAFQPKDCKFLGGDFLNATTELRYGGDTQALNRFLDQLATCPDVIVSISFVTKLVEEADWQVSHSAHADAHRFHVQINSRSTQLKLEDLVIPEIKNRADPRTDK